jgi:hypothetical protein
LAGNEIRVELTDHSDVHLYLLSVVSKAGYGDFQKEHKLRVEFNGFANSIKGLFITSVEQAPNVEPAKTAEQGKTAGKEKTAQQENALYLKFAPKPEGGARLSFFQKLSLRSVTIFSLDFVQADDIFVSDYVEKKFGAVKIDLEEKTREYEALLSKIEETNPSLAKFMAKEVEGAAPKPLDPKTGKPVETKRPPPESKQKPREKRQ